MPLTIYALLGQCRPASHMVSIKKHSYAFVVSIEIKEEGDNKKIKKWNIKKVFFFTHKRQTVSQKST